MDETLEVSYIGNPISIERLFNLGEYKNLRVKIEANELTGICKYNMMVAQVCDAYQTLFVHQLVDAKLNAKDDDWILGAMNRLKEIRSELTIEEE